MSSDYLKRRVYKEWLPLLGPMENKINRVMSDLYTTYNRKGKGDYFYTRLKSDKNKYVFPKPFEVLQPFRTIKPKDIKVVLIGSHPLTNGGSTGIPFKEKESVFENHAAIDQEVSVIVDCLNKSKLISTKSVNIDNWYMQGIITLYASFTSCSLDGQAHYHLWEPVMKHILHEIYKIDDRIIFVPLGVEPRQLINKTSLSNTALIIDSAGPVRYPLKEYNDFISSDTFKRINYFLKQPINW